MWYERLRRRWELLGFLLLLGWFWWINGLQPLILLLGAAAVHEAGHLLVLWLLGGTTAGVAFSAGGMVIQTRDLRLSYGRELAAVLAGPAANLTAGALCVLLLGRGDFAAACAGAHWVLGAFNLLPAAPLDGWRALTLFLCWIAGPNSGERVANVIGGVFALLLAVGILILMASSGGNLWLLPAAAVVAREGLRVIAETVI